MVIARENINKADLRRSHTCALSTLCNLRSFRRFIYSEHSVFAITMSEKEARESTSPKVESLRADQLDVQSTDSKADEALEYLKQHAGDGHFAHDTARMRRLLRKIDFRVIPFLTLAYLMNFLDKILLNVCTVIHFAAYSLRIPMVQQV